VARDGQRILTYRYDALAWWNALTGKLQKTLAGAGQTIYELAVSRDGQRAATGDFDEKIRLWDLKANRMCGVLPARGSGFGMVYTAAWSRDGRVLFAGYSASESGSGGTLVAWDVAARKVLWKIEAHLSDVAKIAVSPDGRFLASTDNAGVLQKREAQTGKLLWRVRADRLAKAGINSGETEDDVKIRALCWSPDGSTLATGADDTLVKTWDARTGHLRHTFTGHGALINSVTFSPDGRTLLSASDDGSVRFWNALSGAWRGALRTLPGGLNSWIAWTRDGFYDGSANAETFVRWNDGENLLPAAAVKRRRAGVLRELLGAR
jgi:WD40 repeat protein